MYGFTERASIVNVGGERRTEAESYQRRIDWNDLDQRRRYLMLVDDVLENYPDVDGKQSPEAKKVRRALELAGLDGTSRQPKKADRSADDLWPVGTMRIFISHLASRKAEVHELAEVLRAVGFSCFVAHDQIRPSRSWQMEIERALRSCDLLVAYVSPKFAESDWTDQEVGWALGRDLVVIPVSVDGEMPRGFLGTYQAVRRHTGHTVNAFGRDVYDAIIDAVFNEQRPAASAIRSRLAHQIVNVFCRVRTFESARSWFEFLGRIPGTEWTGELRAVVERGLAENAQLAKAVLSDGKATPLPTAVRALMR
jgi:TIR domain